MAVALRELGKVERACSRRFSVGCAYYPIQPSENCINEPLPRGGGFERSANRTRPEFFQTGPPATVCRSSRPPQLPESASSARHSGSAASPGLWTSAPPGPEDVMVSNRPMESPPGDAGENGAVIKAPAYGAVATKAFVAEGCAVYISQTPIGSHPRVTLGCAAPPTLDKRGKLGVEPHHYTI